ncbi:MAG: hydrogenase iron-sulfur subunit [Candidatus Bathyarchaeota archaeon]|nr:hydrogenase iron-sulfur subunit [Candidatus Bathyarchaeota archaeon]
MSEVGVVGIRIDDDYCGRCSVCSSICPYEAISVEAETGEVKVDVGKCQFCGLCYSACPVKAIETLYYDSEHLLKRIEEAATQEAKTKLVMMCRGNSPPTHELGEILEVGDSSSYLPLRVPCVGRIPLEFMLKTLTLGIKEIVTVRCEEDFCRFKEGSRIHDQRLGLTKEVLTGLGYDEDVLKSMTFARKAVYITEECVGCDKCVFICPYEAIDVEPLATPSINLDKCVGCGACALVCPHEAIQIEGFEHKNVSRNIQCFGTAAKELKSRGVSPVVLAFCCQWSEFAALDAPTTWLFGGKVATIEIPCFKGLDPFHVVEALHSGFDGVLAFVCSDSDCKLEIGYEVGERNVEVLQLVLKNLSLQERFQIHTGSPREIGYFSKHLEMFIEKLDSLPLSIPEDSMSAGAG